MRDFRGTTIGWYVHFHEALEPTREEREARLDRYLMLLASPTPAIVKLGLAALKAIGESVAGGRVGAGGAGAAHATSRRTSPPRRCRCYERAAARDAAARRRCSKRRRRRWRKSASTCRSGRSS
jgi:hypothetical protein